MPRPLILLYPEDVPTGLPPRLPAPAYLEVTDDSFPDRVQLRIVQDEAAGEDSPAELWLPRPVVFKRMVWPGEASAGAPGSLLRRPVVVTTGAGHIYGQVVAYSGTELTVRHPGGVTAVEMDAAEEIAPVLVFLLARAHMTFRPASRTRGSMASVHSTILDRLLGLHGEQRSRSTKRLLAGFVPIPRQPRALDTLLWCCPTTGEDRVYSVQHVVDFGYSVDGGAPLPASVTLGDSFCADPAGQSAPPAPGAGPRPAEDELPTPRAGEFADLLDSLDLPDAETPATATPPAATYAARAQGESRVGFARGEAPMGATCLGGTVAEPAECSDVSAPVQIMSLLADYPELLHTYADRLQRLGPKRQRTDRESVSDFVAGASASAEDASDRNGSFRPSFAQRAVHGLITAAEHRGKAPAIFIEYVISSPATKFVPHPAIFCRLFGLNFDVCELSTLHFRRFGMNAQLDHAGSGAVNMRNFSVNVALPKVTSTPCYADISTALRLLTSYANEFCDSPTRRLFAAAQDFAEELSDYGPWSTTEARALAFWFSRVLGSYRRATAHDAEHGTETRMSIRHRFCMQDAELNGVLLKLSRFHDRRSTMPPASSVAGPRRDAPDTAASRQTRVSDKANPRRSVPSAVALAAPRENGDGKQLCLRYISAQGCPSPNPDRCTHHFLGHFVPSTLAPVVKAFIVEKYGGLRADIEQNL